MNNELILSIVKFAKVQQSAQQNCWVWISLGQMRKVFFSTVPYLSLMQYAHSIKMGTHAQRAGEVPWPAKVGLHLICCISASRQPFQLRFVTGWHHIIVLWSWVMQVQMQCHVSVSLPISQPVTWVRYFPTDMGAYWLVLNHWNHRHLWSVLYSLWPVCNWSVCARECV